MRFSFFPPFTIFVTIFVSFFTSLASTYFVHPGLLHTDSDFKRVADKVARQANPWYAGYLKLLANPHSSISYKARPQAVVTRGQNDLPQNYVLLYNDIAAAYALALRWKVTGDTIYAKAACDIVDAWSKTLERLNGSADRFLAAGLYGYQFANAIEILRSYEGWSGFPAARDMMVQKFYPMSKDFLVRHNGAKVDHYWANWDLCNLNGILAIGILSDNQTMFQEAIDYFYNGTGNGAITKAIWAIHENVDGEDLGQVQESGRDQGHTMLVIGLLGIFAQTATNQGIDLFKYLDNRILKGAEYVAKYNLGYDVPFSTYGNSYGTQTVISNASRGNIRPIWELLYNRYAKVQGLDAKYTAMYAERLRNVSGGAEGGGGDYGPNSGGYDQLGYGTLMYSV